MKTILIPVMIALLATGCAWKVAVGKDASGSQCPCPEPAPDIIIVDSDAPTANITRIHAAANLDMGLERYSALQKIVTGYELSEPEQFYFLDTVRDTDLLALQRHGLLMEFVNRQPATPAALDHLIAELGNYDLISLQKTEITNAIIDKR